MLNIILAYIVMTFATSYEKKMDEVYFKMSFFSNSIVGKCSICKKLVDFIHVTDTSGDVCCTCFSINKGYRKYGGIWVEKYPGSGKPTFSVTPPKEWTRNVSKKRSFLEEICYKILKFLGIRR